MHFKEDIRINPARVINKYVEAIRSNVFVSYEKDFAQKVISALSQEYNEGSHEPPLVQVVEDVVNSVDSLIARNNRMHFELSTKSVFVHGNKSQVEFDFYGQRKQRELCDLIFIISVVLNSRKYFEKATLNQFKRDKIRHKITSWSLDNREQIYLLSSFPSFWGLKGSLIPIKRYNLPNYSGCLGSYGFLYKPGDFAFVSAPRLSSFIGDKKTLRMTDLYNLADNRMSHIFGYNTIVLSPLWPILGNCHFCQDISSFLEEYLKMNIGEPVFMIAGWDNPQAKNFLHELMNVIENKAKKTGDQRIFNFINAFRKFPYEIKEKRNPSAENLDFAFDGGGIGVIHTTVDLGE